MVQRRPRTRARRKWPHPVWLTVAVLPLVLRCWSSPETHNVSGAERESDGTRAGRDVAVSTDDGEANGDAARKTTPRPPDDSMRPPSAMVREPAVVSIEKGLSASTLVANADKIVGVEIVDSKSHAVKASMNGEERRLLAQRLAGARVSKEWVLTPEPPLWLVLHIVVEGVERPAVAFFAGTDSLRINPEDPWSYVRSGAAEDVYLGGPEVFDAVHARVGGELTKPYRVADGPDDWPELKTFEQ